MKVFKKGQPIVLGIHAESGLFSQINEDDFELKLAYAFNPLDEWNLDTNVVNDDPYWWTKPFYIFKEGDYIIHWINNNDNINVKELFRVENEYYDSNDSEVIL